MSAHQDLFEEGISVTSGTVWYDATLESELCPLSRAVSKLQRDGIAVNVSLLDATGALLIAEAVNCAAKKICSSYYDLKNDVVLAVARMEGVTSGYAEEGSFVLCHADVGSAHFHGVEDGEGKWKGEWSGIKRQWTAIRRLRADGRAQKLATIYADRT